MNDEPNADLFFLFSAEHFFPVRMDNKCQNNPDSLFNICGNVIPPTRQANITDLMKKAYHDYFRVKVGDQS